ncbi:MAG: hypothetical protein BWY04_01383 [candidate division CPR1 bacterium ADurb.Bin160]|uniref:Uncharacterized protein n=1 Tax=candidate division CPR1 bacterium ADurb.Bin160 TaxID=1852826 RepID=A0A1V5ZK16_9BACT|nr:MAG: hypothetical protein BWY04_01383 [candidate division CPR1 bacterium ADurb.Bin160]
MSYIDVEDKGFKSLKCSDLDETKRIVKDLTDKGYILRFDTFPPNVICGKYDCAIVYHQNIDVCKYIYIIKNYKNIAILKQEVINEKNNLFKFSKIHESKRI